MRSPTVRVASNSRVSGTDELRLKNVTIKTFLPDPGVHHTHSSQSTPAASAQTLQILSRRQAPPRKDSRQPVFGLCFVRGTILDPISTFHGVDTSRGARVASAIAQLGRSEGTGRSARTTCTLPEPGGTVTAHPSGAGGKGGRGGTLPRESRSRPSGCPPRLSCEKEQHRCGGYDKSGGT